MHTVSDKTEDAILVVSFGTSYNDSREKTIGAIETAVSAARDSSRAMAAVLAAAVSRARGRIFMQRSGSALKMQPLAVRK